MFPHLKHHCLSTSSVEPRLCEALGEMDIFFIVAVLHWVERARLAHAVANIDESLRDGALLLISDILPSTRRKNPIRHPPNHFTYKQDYSQTLLSLGIYGTVAINVQVAAEPADLDAQERRIATHLLRKYLTDLYPVGYPG